MRAGPACLACLARLPACLPVRLPGLPALLPACLPACPPCCLAGSRTDRPPTAQVNSLSAATEAACVILSIDETVRNPRSKQPGEADRNGVGLGPRGGPVSAGMGGAGMAGMVGAGRGRGGMPRGVKAFKGRGGA